MELYVVSYSHWESYLDHYEIVIGIYSSKEKAIDCIKESLRTDANRKLEWEDDRFDGDTYNCPDYVDDEEYYESDYYITRMTLDQMNFA